MCLNNYGQIAQTCWRAIPQHFPLVWLDIFVIMPNHLHAIVQIIGYAQYQGGALPRGADLSGSVGDVSTLRRLSNGTAAGSLSAIIQNFKSVTARKINQVKQGTSIGIWQRNYYERVIRNENELKAIRQYIEDNPLKWALDRENFVP
jgi:putative transposase